MTWFTSSVGPKGQITLPKAVRKMLQLREKEDVVGFLIDEKQGAIRLVRMEIRPAEEGYTEEELRKMLGLVKARETKKFSSAEDFIKYLEKL